MGTTAALLVRETPVSTPAGAPPRPSSRPEGAGRRPLATGCGSRFRPGAARATVRFEHAAVQFAPGTASGRSGARPEPRAVVGELGAGMPLAAGVARSFGTAYGVRLDHVRVHPDSAVPGRYGAGALTVGSHVAFAPGRFAPGTPSGQELLGHELAHVAQQAGGTAGGAASGGRSTAGDPHEAEADASARAALRGQTAPPLSAVSAPAPQADDGPACFAEAPVCEPAPEPAAPMCLAPPAVSPVPAALLPSSGTLQERIAAFKALVRTTAVLRLRSNQANLAQWSQLVATVIPTGDLAATGLLQTGGARAYFELQDIRDPAVRELRAHQAAGRYRACTGCHVENDLWGSRPERQQLGGREWLSPNEQRLGLPTPGLAGYHAWTSPASFSGLHGAGNHGLPAMPSGPLPADAPAVTPGYRPQPGTAEARLNVLFPDPDQVLAQMERARPILRALGPEGYRVLPADVLDTASPAVLRSRIQAAITERGQGYDTLIARIRSGSLGYEHFGPIIRDLLPAADPAVRAAIQEEMDDKQFWDRVEAVVVGVLTVAALIATLFPPTSAAGLIAVGALDVGLGVYGAVTGPGVMETGQAYSLATGAHDVLTPQQQQSGGMMVLGGFFSVALAPLAVVGGLSRMAAGASRLGGTASAGTALSLPGGAANLQAGQTVQRGRYVMTLAEDGAVVVTLTDRTDVMIVVRDGTATAYQLTGTGGLRVLESAPVPGWVSGSGVPAATPAPAGQTPLLLPAPRPPVEPGPLVLPSRSPAAGQPAAYLMPMGPQGAGGVLVMGRGLRPADFGLVTIAEDAALLGMWNDAMRAATSTGRANAFTRYLDAVENGTVAGWSSGELGAAFDVVNTRFLAAARASGRDLATVHHWNFPKSQYAGAITDPRHLVPIPEAGALRGGWHPMHQGGLHPLTTGNPAQPTVGPVAPVHAIDLGPAAHPLAPR